ncbi:calcium/sodium antiporter [Methanoculleus frigidifontis]|nr:calcium/sodium antiporter [Methanoculleus sp. FWC-SCC1]
MDPAMLVSAIGFVVGIVLLVKGADVFVGGAGGLAARLRISSTLAGITVAAFGTSFPELIVGIEAALVDNPGLALGNVIGSTVANIALVLAVCAIVNPDVISKEPGVQGISEVALMLGATLLFAILALRMIFDPIAAALMLTAFALIMWRLISLGVVPETHLETHGPRDYLLTGAGLAAVIIGADLLVTTATDIALVFGISPFVIGVSMVAVGTSLPELATSLVAVVRGEGGISVGNIIGSNIFNLLFVTGAVALIHPIPIGSYADILGMVLFTVAILPFFAGSSRVRRCWGVLMLAAYAGYIALLYRSF